MVLAWTFFCHGVDHMPCPAGPGATCRWKYLQRFLPMGSGSSVALPEGAWQVINISSQSSGGNPNPQSIFQANQRADWEVYSLKNQQIGALVPFLVVRQTLNSVRWGNTNCLSNSASQFMVNEHGTRSNELLNKCSRYFSIGNFDEWKTGKFFRENEKQWWSEATKNMPDLASGNKNIFLLEMQVQVYNGRGIRLEAFLLPPRGVTVAKFKDEFKAGKLRPEHQLLSGWTSIYMESIQQSYFNKKPQPIMALAYPVNSDGQTPATPADIQMAAAAPATEDATADRVEKEREQRTQEVIREMETASTHRPQAKPPAPATAPVLTAAQTVKPAPVVKPAAATPATPAAPAPAPVADNSAQLRFEQERRAMDEDRRKMAQQLEAMTQMLAKLQQENVAAAAAAKAKEQAAAAPEPMAPKEPMTYANRKALVIGNDLYAHVPKLNNAGADANAMAKSLEAVGYKVFKHLNLTEKQFKQAVRDFRQNLTGGDEVLFFYAGHGVQLGNANYLLPIDVQGDQEDQVKDDAILLQKVLDDLEEKKTKFALAVIDACRDNPFKSKGRAIGGRGLAPTSAATGQMIMFSAGSGQQALDRLGDNDKEKNGLFTRIFVKEMVKPGLSVDRVLRNVRNEVVRLARSVGHEQTPALYDQAIGEFYFKQ
ncbi:hypothetical protein B9Z31_03845 [Limnohabitans sp. G3-2]|nr:hypothetical protein B9Z31_03845 [Limnohabitans sp. G3-2]